MANWDSFGAPEAGFVEQCYFLRMHTDDEGRTLAALVDPEGTAAVSIRYSAEHLPAFTIWRNTAAEADGYVVGLEPISGGMTGCGAPAGSLAPGQTKTYECALSVLTDPRELRRFIRRWG